ncbi:tRNA (adenosine(37)-N6)-threonylcarbamoyltransferase complex ATPase subunit type 1 TsaE [Gaoshiqia sediminis]|uniref:tRNA threonylcarbamoyladenosine biosynthesis protein TsaE n=1 Tax=Gaoshiqia sediminis TaxID=2986998 RepID=A0AA41Y641_9BACT|nr:tRNA (adenosine(37)-N6)-threonylcarbamoyltransferase complex ATPase subunit type 1 TsaE [Gaoshiqia sediminis]MCW0482619.1 tRNA (adenosine(37)-N6)-threonylcarbamoyltransferase complex ATPase subunit type 1 TsaE [Gaoshiqia sediminis]
MAGKSILTEVSYFAPKFRKIMLSIQVNSVDGLKQAAKQLLEVFQDDRIFAFYGKMGAGKTTFIKALCRAMGSVDNITSPSFALINEYDTAGDEKIFHFDFYRIKDVGEALDIGFDDYIYSGQYCFMEWPEKIEPLLPENLVEVHIEEISPTARQIKAFRL